MPKQEKLTVFYDGACPVCSREVSFYRQCSGADALTWTDVSLSVECEVAPGLSKEAALGRFHVATPDGRLVAGGKAFAAVWTAIPRFRVLGRTFRIWPLRCILNFAYDLFLMVRPLLQAVVPERKEDL